MCRNDCKDKKSVHPGRAAGLWSGLFLLFVPKCPFCFMAFSSVMVFCGKNSTGQSPRTFHSTTTLILTAIFCLTALLSMIVYYRPAHGKYALLLAIPGIAALICSVTEMGGMSLYYFGALLVMAGLLRNSGLWTFVQGKFTFRKNPRTNYTDIKLAKQ
jgi:hypothetical protein